MLRTIQRHKDCGGFILPDVKNSFTGMTYGYCPKCGQVKIMADEIVTTEEDIVLYTIQNEKTGEFLNLKNGDETEFTVQFESEEQAVDFAEMHGITGYEVKQNVALYCDEASVTNGKMIIGKGGEE